jgi:hypothetical protein
MVCLSCLRIPNLTVCNFQISGVKWKFVPSKFTRPPKEFLIYGNVIRQTVLDNFVVKMDKGKQ